MQEDGISSGQVRIRSAFVLCSVSCSSFGRAALVADDGRTRCPAIYFRPDTNCKQNHPTMTEEGPWSNESKEELKRLVIDTITQQCHAAAAAESTSGASAAADPPADLIACAKALSNGHQLHLTILTGGLANLSFRAHFPTAPPDTPSLFAKLTFTYALLFPDKPCPITRTRCEFEAMKLFRDCAASSPRASDASITPYLCVDVGPDKKLLVTEYSPLDEQFANQFIDGAVDLRVAPRLAHSLAALHSLPDVDVGFNEDMKPFFQDLATMLEGIFGSFFAEQQEDGPTTGTCTEVVDRPTELARSLGRSALDDIYKAYCRDLERTDCYVHGDTHVFNMLVGAKPSVAMLENFDKCGDVCLIDWEMSHCGPIGKDIGFFHPFPVATIFAHSFNGNVSGATNILQFLDILWDEYSQAISTEVELTDVYRSVLGFAGVILIAYNKIGFHMEHLPLYEGNTDGLNRIKESLGVIGLKCMNWGFGRRSDKTLSDLRQMFKDALAEEVKLLTPAKAVRRGRRSSMLRASGRRVSDAHLHVLSGSIKNNRNSLLRAEALIAEVAEAEEEE